MPTENEVKIQISPSATWRSLSKQLVASGMEFTHADSDTFEDNILLDSVCDELAHSGRILRVRHRVKPSGKDAGWLLTFKRRIDPRATGMKSCQEIETRVEDGQALLDALCASGFRVRFRYQRYRSTFNVKSEEGWDGELLVLDRTPIGTWIEIEGTPRGINAIAAKLGHDPGEYDGRSYEQLFRQLQRETEGACGEHMLFAPEDLPESPGD